MPPRRLSNLIKRISSSRPGAYVLARLLPPLDHWWFRRSGGSSLLTSLFVDVPTVMVTTIGAKSGLPRSTPLLAISSDQSPSSFALIATNFGQESYPAWYFNLKANPRAVCTWNGVTRTYQAHEASGEEYETYWQLAIQAYFGYSLYRQRIHHRHIPIMVLTPVDESPLH